MHISFYLIVFKSIPCQDLWRNSGQHSISLRAGACAWPCWLWTSHAILRCYTVFKETFVTAKTLVAPMRGLPMVTSATMAAWLQTTATFASLHLVEGWRPISLKIKNLRKEYKFSFRRFFIFRLFKVSMKITCTDKLAFRSGLTTKIAIKEKFVNDIKNSFKAGLIKIKTIIRKK